MTVEQKPEKTAMRPVRRRAPTAEAAAKALEPPAHRPPAPPPVASLNNAAALFFGCLGVGIALASLGMFSSPVLHSISLFGPILATIAYPLLGLAMGLGADAQSRERFGDNCYYLGFIFTQAALLFGFLPTAVLNRAIESADVLRFFGVAIAASMIGLVARTLLVQTGRSVAEVDNALQSEMEMLAVAVSDQSRRVFGRFETLSRELGDAHEAVNSRTQAQLVALSKSMEDYQALLRTEIDVLQAGSGRVGDAAARAEREFDGHQRGFGQDIHRAAAALEQLQAGLSAQVNEARTAIQSSAHSLAEGAEALRGLSGLADSVGALQARVADIDGATQTLDVTLQRASGVLDDATATVVSELGTASARTGEMLENVVDQAAASLRQSVARSSDRLQAGAQEARDELNGRSAVFQDDLQGAVEALKQTLTAFREEMERVRLDSGTQPSRKGRKGAPGNG